MLQGQLAGLMNNGGPAQSLGPPPNMMQGNHGNPSMHGQDWMSQPQMPVNGHSIGMPPPPAGPPHPNMQSSMQPNMQGNMQANMQANMQGNMQDGG